MKPLFFVAIGLGAFLTGCSGHAVREQVDAPYIAPDALDFTRLLPPPPVDLAQARDLEAVRAAQRARTPAQVAEVEIAAGVTPYRFAVVLGPSFTAERVPVTARFLAHVNRDISGYINGTKDCWRRPRPFVVDNSIQPPPKVLASANARGNSVIDPNRPADSPCTDLESDPRYMFSYPSGHSTFGAMTAILLAQMVPERRQQLFALGWEYGDARIIGGVHYPSDVEAGRILATSLVAVMMQNPHFRNDLRAAKTELRAALALKD